MKFSIDFEVFGSSRFRPYLGDQKNSIREKVDRGDEKKELEND